MTLKNTIARINGLNEQPYYNKEKLEYFWDITFSDRSTNLRFENLAFIRVGKTKEEAEKFCNELKKKFENLHINNGCKVNVLFTSDGSVHAIKSAKNKKNLWIDVDDKFAIKNLCNLNVLLI